MSFINHSRDSQALSVAQTMTSVTVEGKLALYERVEALRSARTVQGLYAQTGHPREALDLEPQAPIAYRAATGPSKRLSFAMPCPSFGRVIAWTFGALSFYGAVLTAIAFQSRILEF